MFCCGCGACWVICGALPCVFVTCIGCTVGVPLCATAFSIPCGWLMYPVCMGAWGWCFTNCCDSAGWGCCGVMTTFAIGCVLANCVLFCCVA